MSDTTNGQPAETDMMGYEDLPTAPETTLPATSNAEDVQALINKTVKEVTVDDNGKYVYPDNIDPMLKSAVAATKSYRDNQSGFTKSQQALKESEAETKALREQLAKSAQPLELSPEEAIRMNGLLDSDPEEWRQEMNKIDSTNAGKLDEMTDEVKQRVRAQGELDRRVNLLEELNSTREKPIDVDMLDNDVPARINNKLANSEITFEEYLVEVSTYIDAGKTVAKPADTKTIDLNQANGSSTSKIAGETKEDGVLDYSQQAF